MTRMTRIQRCSAPGASRPSSKCESLPFNMKNTTCIVTSGIFHVKFITSLKTSGKFHIKLSTSSCRSSEIGSNFTTSSCKSGKVGSYVMIFTSSSD